MRSSVKPYDSHWLWGTLFALIGMGLAMRFTAGAAFFLIFPMILVGFGKNRTELLLFCLMLDIAMVMSNSNVIPKSGAFSIAARSVYFLVAGVMVMQMTAQRRSRLLGPMLGILVYLVYMAVVSAVGWQPLISYLKLFLFVTVFMAFFSVANAVVSRQGVDARKIRAICLAFAVFFLVGSVALLPFPSLGMMRAEFYLAQGLPVPEGSLFAGMCLHSQALGPVVATIGTLVLADMLFCVRRWEKLYLLLLFCAPILIYKTGSRTAMGAYFVGVCFTTFLFICARGVGATWKNRAAGALLMLGAIGGVALVAVPQLREGVARFVLKYASEGSGYEVTMDEVLATRQGSMEQQLQSFSESPVIGNGFQVSKQMEGMDVTSIGQLLSAPVEKGVWVTAALEEGGILGFLLLVLFFVVACIQLWERQAYVGLSVFVVMIIMNLGEFVMFSMTSTGGLVWAMIFCGLALDSQKRRHENAWRFSYGVGSRKPAFVEVERRRA